MIEKDLNILKELIQEKANWKQKEAFNKVVNHCDFLDNNFKDKSKFLEVFTAWYISFKIEFNNEKWKCVDDFYVKHLILDQLNIVLSTPIETYLTRIENDIQLIALDNEKPFFKSGSIVKTFRKIIRDFVAQQTKDNYAEYKNRLRH